MRTEGVLRKFLCFHDVIEEVPIFWVIAMKIVRLLVTLILCVKPLHASQSAPPAKAIIDGTAALPSAPLSKPPLAAQPLPAAPQGHDIIVLHTPPFIDPFPPTDAQPIPIIANPINAAFLSIPPLPSTPELTEDDLEEDFPMLLIHPKKGKPPKKVFTNDKGLTLRPSQKNRVLAEKFQEYKKKEEIMKKERNSSIGKISPPHTNQSQGLNQISENAAK